MRHLLESIERGDLRVSGREQLNLTERRDERRETAVKTKKGVADKSADWNVVKHIGEIAPYIRRLVLAKTLFINSIYLCNLTTLVVSTNNVKSVGISQLQNNDMQHSF